MCRRIACESLRAWAPIAAANLRVKEFEFAISFLFDVSPREDETIVRTESAVSAVVSVVKIFRLSDGRFEVSSWNMNEEG